MYNTVQTMEIIHPKFHTNSYYTYEFSWSSIQFNFILDKFKIFELIFFNTSEKMSHSQYILKYRT